MSGAPAAPFELYPAIDLRGGHVVRLHQGDYGAQTTYGDDPLAVAAGFVEAGARWIHVVDLDAARAQGSNRPVVAAIAAATGARVQTGGGVRTPDDAAALLDAGVERVVVGTAAFRSPGLVRSLCDAHPGRIAVDLGVAASGALVVQGWQEEVPDTLGDALARFAADGAVAFVLTSVAVDGTMAGPALALYEEALTRTDVPVVASGGIGSLDHVLALADLGVAGAIAGRAIYEGRLDVAEAVRRLAG